MKFILVKACYFIIVLFIKFLFLMMNFLCLLQWKLGLSIYHKSFVRTVSLNCELASLICEPELSHILAELFNVLEWVLFARL